MTIDSFLTSFIQTFIPLFVAIDALGILPVFLNLTLKMPNEERQKIITQATAAALLVSTIFLFLGRGIFSLLGISEHDFRVAGGVVLLVISIADLAFAGYRVRANQSNEIGVVPIGIPLMIGPAALTTILVLADQHGALMTLFTLVLNLLITWFIFRRADMFFKLMGESGAKAFGKIMALFLAAIAVRMIRVGLLHFTGN